MHTMLVLSTAGSTKEATRIAQVLVEEKLAACINIIPGLTSVFYWGGKICQEKEVILFIKTNEGQLKKIINKIKNIHSYELPEILYFKINGGEKKYLQWIKGILHKKNIDNKKPKR